MGWPFDEGCVFGEVSLLKEAKFTLRCFSREGNVFLLTGHAFLHPSPSHFLFLSAPSRLQLCDTWVKGKPYERNKRAHCEQSQRNPSVSTQSPARVWLHPAQGCFLRLLYVFFTDFVFLQYRGLVCIVWPFLKLPPWLPGMASCLNAGVGIIMAPGSLSHPRSQGPAWHLWARPHVVAIWIPFLDDSFKILLVLTLERTLHAGEWK